MWRRLRTPLCMWQGYHDPYIRMTDAHKTVARLMRAWDLTNEGAVIDGAESFTHTRYTSAANVTLETIYHGYYSLPAAELRFASWGQ